MRKLFQRRLVRNHCYIAICLLGPWCALALNGIGRCDSAELVPAKLANERAGDLIKLANDYFENLSTGESAMLEAIPSGRWSADKDADIGTVQKDQRHTIRALLLRWLVTDPDAAKLLDPSGIEIDSAWIDGELNLQNAALTLPLTLHWCVIADGLDLISATAGTIDLKYSQALWIWGTGLAVQRDLALTGGSYGQVILNEAQIGRDLYLDDAYIGTRVNRQPSGSFALVDLEGAQIGGSLYLNGAAAMAGDQANVLNASGAQIHGDAYISKFKGKGEGRFKTDGYLIMEGARIDGLLSMTGTRFVNEFSNGLKLTYAKVGGGFLWREIGLTPKTELRLDDANIGVLTLGDPVNWPAKRNLSLDGCVFGGFGESKPLDDETQRLNWLHLQADASQPQPYEMLAKVLSDEGRDDDAVQVRIDEENAARLKLHGWRRVVDTLLYGTVEYGYVPMLAGVWILGFVALGAGLFYLGHKARLIVPTDKEAYTAYIKSPERSPAGYQSFNSVVYSIESFLPLVQLFVLSRWLPDPRKTRGRLLRCYLWLHVLAGWFFTTMLVAGLSGLVKK